MGVAMSDDQQPLPAPGAGLAGALQGLLNLIGSNKGVSLLLYAGFVFVKVLAVSRFTVTTALAVLNLSSLPGVVAGATLSAIPMVALLLLASILFLWTSGYWRERWSPPGERASGSGSAGWRQRIARLWRCARRSQRLLWSLLIVTLLAVALPPWVVSVAAVVCGVLPGLMVRVRAGEPRYEPVVRQSTLAKVRGVASCGSGQVAGSRSRRPAATRRPVLGCARWIGGVAGLLVLLVLGYTQLVSSVWIPHETLTSPDGQVLDVGYVINDDNGVVTVLESHRRTLAIYRASQVGDRSVCVDRYAYPLWSGHTFSARSFIQLVPQLRTGSPPQCPTVPGSAHASART